MVDSSTVNITMFYGEEVKEDDAAALNETLTAKYPNCEVSVLSGGQPVYYYLISVE